MILRLFRHFGFLEVWCRRISMSSPKIRKFFKKLYKRILGGKRPSGEGAALDTQEKQLESRTALFNYLESLGVQNGDILIVHSDFDVLKKTGIKPKEIIDFLLKLVGEEGTLVFPAYPVTTRPDIFAKQNTEKLVYDPKRTPSWTGLLPNVFCMYPGVVRSQFPYNSLAAKGKHAEAMMEGNLDGLYPHEKNSAWGYCIEHHAKILFISAEMIRSNTLNHATEDYMADRWPIDNWYEDKEYIVKTDQGEIPKKIKVFSGKWTKYSRPNRLVYLMCKKGLALEARVKGVYVGFIPDSKKYLNEQIRMAEKGWIRYMVPKKYYKK